MAKANVILGVDPGKALGFAVIKGRRRVTSGVLNYESPAARWAQLATDLELLCSRYSVDVMAVELPNIATLKSWHAVRSIVGSIVIAEMVAATFNIQFETVAVKTIKKVATGNGNATKAMMVEAVQIRWRRDVGPVDGVAAGRRLRAPFDLA